MSIVRPEIGNPGNMEQALAYPFTVGANRYVPKPPEHTWDLEWPLNIAVYSEMRRSDGQIGSLLKAVRLTIQAAPWTLDETGCRQEVVDFVRSELGMTEPGQHRQRARRNGIVWKDHLRDALLMLPFGNMFFEQVYAYRPEDNRIHLRKLAPRLPTTIEEILLARDGGLHAIRQTSPDPTRHPNGILIPVDRLVAYVLDREGADWTGNSILRTAYKHWLIKDQIMRVDAQSVERNGMGIPVMHYDPNTEGAKEEAERIVAEVRAGEAAGVVIPMNDAGQAGGFELVGVSGSTVDAVPRMEYHDQQISRSALAMFLDLGHDAGARSLGDTFRDFFEDSTQAVADDIAEVATEHIVRDLVEANWGPNEPYPVVSPGQIKDDKGITADALSTLANAGILTADAETENFVRGHMGLPERNPESPANVAPLAPARDFVASEGGSTVERLEAIVSRLAQLHGGQ